MNIAHIFPNQPKFFQGATEFFADLPWNQEWHIRCPTDKLPSFESTHFTEPKRFDEEQFAPDQYDGLVIHYLDEQMSRLVANHQKTTPIYIQLWGGDIEDLRPVREIHGDLAMEFFYSQSRIPIPYTIAKYFYPTFYIAKKKFAQHKINQLKIEAINSARHTSFLCGTVESETVPRISVEPSNFRVRYGIEQFNANLHPGNKRKILLGNSSTSSNRHLEALHTLKESSYEFDEIVLPLSYGGAQYRKWLSTKAEELFPNRITLLTHFMPRNEYFQTVNECGIVIMNHVRQQALGNVIWAVASGKHLLLNQSGVNYRFLLENGIIAHPFNTKFASRLDEHSPAKIKASLEEYKKSVLPTAQEKLSFFQGVFS